MQAVAGGTTWLKDVFNKRSVFQIVAKHAVDVVVPCTDLFISGNSTT
jgi:hypothetical protein